MMGKHTCSAGWFHAAVPPINWAISIRSGSRCLIVVGANRSAALNATIVGALLVVLAFRRGPQREHYAAWDRYIV